VIPDGRRPPLYPGNGAAFGTFLVEGEHRGTWRIDRTAESATLVVEPFGRLSIRDAEELTEEGAALLRFVAGTSPVGEVTFAPHGLR
jgi:hypothetical protein